jgi:hypothetical protein
MKDLVQIIRDNPGCVAIVDNDCWTLYKSDPYAEDAPEDNELACDGDIKPLGDGGYGSGCRYGGDILQALAAIIGIRIESA